MPTFNQLREVIESVSEVTAQHVRLARLELKEDARFVGARVGLIAALAPLILVGYGLISVAAALALRRLLPADLAFLVVGALNLGVGILAISRAASQLKGHSMLDQSRAELKVTSGLTATSAGLLKGEPKP